MILRVLSLGPSLVSTGTEGKAKNCKESRSIDSRRRKEGRKEKKMIHRKWSLLTGPVAILGGIVGTVVVANLLFVQNDPFTKPPEKKNDASSSTKS